ncbi:MAG: hypothetical protein JWO69_1601 [Thermoleophilia bacterium]|nr:hypothetical protein [Thermoleophilia bacterium]
MNMSLGGRLAIAGLGSAAIIGLTAACAMKSGTSSDDLASEYLRLYDTKDGGDRKLTSDEFVREAKRDRRPLWSIDSA